MKAKKEISLLNKIRNKTLIINKIFPYSLNRPYMLFHIISNESILKNRLNNIFSKVSKYSNKLDKEFNNNLIFYSLIPNILNKLSELYNKIKSNYFSYDNFKKEYNLSIIQYLFDSITKYMQKQSTVYYNLNSNIIKGIILDFYSLQESAIITMFSKDAKYLDCEYVKFGINANKKSSEKNKISQKVKLILLFDDNYFYNKDIQEIEFRNVNEIELMFGDETINKMNIFNFFNNYLSSVVYIENINKIIFHNVIYENYLSDKIYVKVKNECYQSLLNFLFDGYYSEDNDNIKSQLKLLNNVREIKFENNTSLYIYEKLKLYYCINEIFPSLYNSNKTTKNDIHFYFINKILIINNKEKNLKLSKFIQMINCYLKNNNKIQYLFIFNHNKLIKDDDHKIIEEEIKLDKINLKEFMYITENNDNDPEVLDKLFNLNDGNNSNNVYKGYDISDKLIFYREGETHMQSFDLIDLFKYNKELVKVNLIKEKIIIKYNKERTHLEILNINEIKSELSNIVNHSISLNISHFTQLIFNQYYLKELTINKFDFCFKDIINTNINILNINYDNNLSIMKYKLIEDESNTNIKNIFQNLTNLNIGGDCQRIFNLQIKDFPKKLKSLKILSKFSKKNKISKLKKRFYNNGKELITEYIYKKEENKDNSEDTEEEEEEDEEEMNYYEKIYNKFDKNFNRTDIIMKDPYYKKSSDKSPFCKYCDRLYYNGMIENIRGEKFFKEFNEKHNNKFSNIFEISKILKEYKTELKILSKLDFWKYKEHYNINNLKLKYRASEKKYSFEDFIHIGSEIQLNGKKFIIIIKMNNDFYFFYENNYYYAYFFSNDGFKLVESPDIIFSEDSCKVEMKSNFFIKDSYANGILLTDIKFKDKIIPKQTSFFVIDLELYEKIESKVKSY